MCCADGARAVAEQCTSALPKHSRRHPCRRHQCEPHWRGKPASSSVSGTATSSICRGVLFALRPFAFEPMSDGSPSLSRVSKQPHDTQGLVVWCWAGLMSRVLQHPSRHRLPLLHPPWAPLPCTLLSPTQKCPGQVIPRSYCSLSSHAQRESVLTNHITSKLFC